MPDWDGIERRSMNGDSELLARIDERTKNIDAKLDAHAEAMKEHVIEDGKQWKRIDEINLRIAKWTGVGTGAGSIIGFIISRFIK